MKLVSVNKVAYLLFFIASMSIASDLPEYLKNAYPENTSAIEFLLENDDLSMSGSEKYWEIQGGFPKELEELEKLGLIFILKYKFGKDGLGFKIYPTKKAIDLFEHTKLAGKYRYSDIEANIKTARTKSRYYYITEFK